MTSLPMAQDIPVGMRSHNKDNNAPPSKVGATPLPSGFTTLIATRHHSRTVQTEQDPKDLWAAWKSLGVENYGYEYWEMHFSSVVPAEQYLPDEPRHLSRHTLKEILPRDLSACINFEHWADRPDVKDLHESVFVKVLEFTDLTSSFAVALYHTLRPGESLDEHHLYNLYVSITPVNSDFIWDTVKSFSLSGTLKLAQPQAPCAAKGYDPESIVICAFDDVVFNRTTRSHLISIDYPYEIPRKFRLYALNWGSPTLDFILDLSWTKKSYSSNDFSGLLKVLHIPELLLFICDALNLYDIQSLRHTCKYFHQSILNTIPEERMRHDLESILTVDPGSSIVPAFAALLRRTGSVVGGSMALSILCPGDWTPGDLDMVVEEKHWRDVQRFIEGRTNLVFDKEKSDNQADEYPFDEENPVSVIRRNFSFTYKHYNSPIEDAPGIDICITRPMGQASSSLTGEGCSSPSTDVISEAAKWILTYHSTVVMNFWNGSHLYCLWPELTFSNLLLRNRHTPISRTDRAERAFAKYRSRGWTDVHRPRSFGKFWPLNRGTLKHGEEDRLIQDIVPESRDVPLGIEHVTKPMFRVPLMLAEKASGIENDITCLNIG